MKTIAKNIVNNSFWNNISFDELYNMDDLFSSTFDFIYQQEYPQHLISNNEKYEEIPSYDVNTVFILLNIIRRIFVLCMNNFY